MKAMFEEPITNRLPKRGSAADDELACAWLRAVANGDRSSFRKLHDRFDGLLFTIVFRVLNNRQDSEDVVQEVFASVWRKASMYAPDKGKPATWLASMARNRAIDRLRLKQRHARLAGKAEQDCHLREQERHAPSGAELAMRRERCLQVNAAVTRLAPDQEEAIRLAYFEGLTQKAIAERLGKPLGTVKARIRRGMSALRERL